jgi:signal transduction histidine kinase
MKDAVNVLSAAQVVLYVGLAVLAGVRWKQRRGAARGWVFATFAVLGAVVVVGQLVPEKPEGGALWAVKLLVAALALFPYFLYRFAETFERPAPTVRWLSVGLTVTAAGGIFLLDRIPAADEPRSTGFQVYVFVIFAQWLFLMGQVAIRLWRGGTGRATVARRRMRTLSLGAAAMALALALAAFAPAAAADDPGIAQLVTSVIALLAAPLFVLGVSPPRAVLSSWRRPDEQALRTAEADLMGASNEEEVANTLLPHVARALAANAATLTDADGRVVATYGTPTGDGNSDAARLTLPIGRGRLAVDTDAYTPYFGRQEAEVVQDLVSLTDVAMRRARVTERERQVAQDLADANQAMREFVAIASHDLRTPISLVRGYASLLLGSWDTLADADKRKHLEAIERQGSHLSRLVDDLLTISRLDAKALQPDAHDVRLAEAVNEVVRDLGRDDDVECGIEDDLVASVDPEHLGRIVRNLVENAFAYGEPPVELGASLDGDGSSVLVRVRDHGDGVPPDFLPRLFGRFARAETTKTREQRGTGLGLSIVRGLAQANGGDIHYEPASDGGACFVLRLPRKR